MADKPNTTQLERGDIYFFYRPKVHQTAEAEHVNKFTDIQRLYIVLHPYRQTLYRLLIIGRKRLPNIAKHEKYWVTVDLVTQDIKVLQNSLKGDTYSTKTRGERVLPEARACGEGVYSIIDSDNNTYFTYHLCAPAKPKEVQLTFNIRPEASYIISIKNQAIAGVTASKKAELPKKLQDKLNNLRFAPLNPPEFLNYINTEILLIGASDYIKSELSSAIANPANFNTDKIFTDLRLWKNEHTTKPLFKGQWT